MKAAVFSSSLLALSAALLPKLSEETERNYRVEKGRGECEGRRGGVRTCERREFFCLLEQRENCILWKQMQASRIEDRQMGMARKSGRDKETFAEWK